MCDSVQEGANSPQEGKPRRLQVAYVCESKTPFFQVSYPQKQGQSAGWDGAM